MEAPDSISATQIQYMLCTSKEITRAIPNHMFDTLTQANLDAVSVGCDFSYLTPTQVA